MRKLMNPQFALYTLSAALLATGCANKSTGGSSNTAVTTVSATSSPSSSSALSVAAFSPASGLNISAMPTTVLVTYSESNLDANDDSSSVNYPSNYILECGTNEYFATSVSYNGNGVATVTLPAVSVSSGTTCTFTAAPSIIDTSGNNLSGGNVASYVIDTNASAVTVSAFSPVSGTVSSLPTSVTVSFSSSSLNVTGNAYSETDAANYALNCGGNSYSVSSAAYTYTGVVTLTLPSLSLSSGTVCTLTTGANLEDGSGNAINSASVSYTVGSGSSTSWNELSSPAFTSYSGSSWTGSNFWDVGSTGIAMSGIDVHAGSFVDQVTGIWELGFNTSSSLYYGPAHGGSGGSDYGNQMCPAGMQMTGVFGTYSTQIDSIGITCSTVNASSTYQSAAVGTAGANSFQLSCATGTFMTDFQGSAGTYVQTLAIGCR